METANQTENKNLNSLLKALDYNGFGALSEKLIENINRQRDEFKLYAADKQPDARGQSLSYELNFRANDEGKYYWNTTKATLSSPDPLTNGRSHSFYAGMYAANQQQMKTLLNGASLFRNKLSNGEGKIYSAWQKIHFSEKTDQYGNHPLRNYYENNGPRVDGALAKWNDTLSMTNGQRAIAIEQFKKGEPTVLTVNVKENNTVKQEKAVVFFDAQYKDLLIVRPDGEVLERKRNSGENIVAVEPQREPAQGNSASQILPQENGGKVNGQQNAMPKPDNSKTLESKQSTVASDAVKEQAKTIEVTLEDRQSKSEKRGVRPGR
jgi:hypothetical protein